MCAPELYVINITQGNFLALCFSDSYELMH